MSTLIRTAAWLVLFRLVGLSSASADPPNIVFMLADDLGWADVSFHAPDRANTPNIDRLAADGVELDRFYVAPMCSPTRAGLMTGRYPIRFGLARAVIPPWRDFGLDVREKTLPEALAAAGYRHRGVFGKWHLGHRRGKWHPLSRGFTQFEGHYNGAIDYFTHEREGQRDWHVDWEPAAKDGYTTDLIAAAASKFIREKAKDDAPYFCYVPFNAPHSPFQAKPKDLARAGVRVGQKPTRAQFLKAMIWSLDEGVGQILKAVDETGEVENTQVWFVSDNGGIAGIQENNLPLRGAKLSTFEGGVRVVACVRWPAQWQGGRKVTETMGYIDVFPTLLETAGVDPKSVRSPQRPFDGVSVAGVLSGARKSLPSRDWYSYQGQGGLDSEQYGLKTNQWKLVVKGPDLRRGGLTDGHRVFLFAMPDDPYEENDLSDQHPDVVKQLVEKLTAHRRLQPADGVRAYNEGRTGFVAPVDWRIEKTTD
jgi:arylsulfatase B